MTFCFVSIGQICSNYVSICSWSFQIIFASIIVTNLNLMTITLRKMIASQNWGLFCGQENQRKAGGLEGRARNEEK